MEVMETIASVYPFGWSDLRSMRLDELRYFAITAAARRDASAGTQTALLKLLTGR